MNIDHTKLLLKINYISPLYSNYIVPIKKSIYISYLVKLSFFLAYQLDKMDTIKKEMATITSFNKLT